MTDNDIIEALNCCQDAIIIRYCNRPGKTIDIHIREISALLNKQQAEIERLKKPLIDEPIVISIPPLSKKSLDMLKNSRPCIIPNDDSDVRFINTPKGIGSLEFYCNDLDKKISIHDYLIELLKALWEEQDEFSGKRPFGNSGWDYDLIGCLIANNIIEGKLDEYGYVIEGDTKKGYALIKEYIESLRGGTKNV